MPGSSDTRVVVLTRPTRLEELVARFNTPGQAKFIVESRGADFSDYLAEHETYKASLAKTVEEVARVGLVQMLPRAFLPNFVFGARDAIVAVGQDGLVANLLKYTEGQPVLGVNPDPARWDGPLLPFLPAEVGDALSDTFAGRAVEQGVTMAEVALSDGQRLVAVNDLFIGPKTHTSARYRIRLGDKSEVQSSSGLLVSTGLGSGAWVHSILTGSTAILAAAKNLKREKLRISQRWDSRELFYAVREPFPTRTTGCEMVFGRIDEGQSLVLESHMAENGVIFSDGIEADFLPFLAGTTATVKLSATLGRLIRKPAPQPAEETPPR